MAKGTGTANAGGGQQSGCLPCAEEKRFMSSGAVTIEEVCKLYDYTTSPPCVCIYRCAMGELKQCVGYARI